MTAPAADVPTQRLDSLLADMTAAPVPGLPVTGVESDSRRVVPGQLFLAIPGVRHNGLEFAGQAVARGAAAVVWDRSAPPADLGVPAFRIPDLDQRVGEIAANFHARPSTMLKVVGVTGTDGKTSCAYILAQALAELGQRCGYVGTLGCGEPPDLAPAAHTTPDPVRLQAWLARLLGEGVAAVALEVSSHALAQSRIAGTLLDTAVLTNVGRDHLDYHGSPQAYAAAKRRLFETPGLAHAVLNGDDRLGAEWAQQLTGELDVVTYGLAIRRAPTACRCLYATRARAGPQGLTITVDGDWGPLELRSGLVGRFNASNLLAVLAVLLLAGVSPEAATAALGRVATVPGRMEVVAKPPQHPLVVVDYAHTPGALDAALASLREHTSGRLHCVFGCGGERDRGKRPEMGAVAAARADMVRVTDDNARSEDPQGIAAAIVAGMPADAAVTVVHDRARAIAEAIAAAGSDDAVLIAGKGHESEQEIAGVRAAFDDRDVARECLEAS